jgi:Kef-type K+ transport system membrane component KefB
MSTGVAIGKLVSGLPVGRSTDRLTIGLGMVPRGEVGLVFASRGKSLGVVSEPVFSALVVMVVATTLITPSALKWSLGRAAAVAASAEETDPGPSEKGSFDEAPHARQVLVGRPRVSQHGSVSSN